MGKRVNIPVLACIAMDDGKVRLGRCWKSRFKHAGRVFRQIRTLLILRCEVLPVRVMKQLIPCSRKVSKLQIHVNRTANRHRWTGRDTKALERTWVEGTRQNDTVTSGEGVPLLGESPCDWSRERLQKSGVCDCFNKNTALCKLARGSIGCDACPCRKVN